MEQTRKTALRLTEILQQKGITAATLAEACDMHPANLSGIINDKRSPNLQTLDRLAQALDVPTWQLLQDPAELTTQLTQQAIAQAAATIAERNQTISDLRALVRDLQAHPHPAAQPDTTQPDTAPQKPADGLAYDLLTIDPLTGEAVRYRRL